MPNNKLSKSQRRKLRLINKGQELALTMPKINNSTTQQVGRAAPQKKSRSARRRTRQRMTGTQALLPKSRDGEYLKSLLYPEFAAGSKVPDEIGYPTGSVQLEMMGTLATGTTGDTVGLQIFPVIGDGVITGGAVWFNSTAINTLANQGIRNWNGRSAIASIYKYTRPVSMLLECAFIGNSSSDAGRLTVGCTYLGGSAPSTSYDTWTSYPDMATWPQKNGCRVVWKPLDNSNFEFIDTTSATLAYRYPVLMFAATGLPVNTTSIMYRVVVNFEGIPAVAAASVVDVEPSPYNPEALRRAWDWAQQSANNLRPLVGIVGNAIEYGKSIYSAANSAGLLTNGGVFSSVVSRFRQSSAMSDLRTTFDSMSFRPVNDEEECVADEDVNSSSVVQAPSVVSSPRSSLAPRSSPAVARSSSGKTLNL